MGDGSLVRRFTGPNIMELDSSPTPSVFPFFIGIGQCKLWLMLMSDGLHLGPDNRVTGCLVLLRPYPITSGLADRVSSNFSVLHQSASGIRSALNSLPEAVVTAQSLNIFKNRLDKHWINQDVVYDWHGEISGTGSRSNIS